MAGVVIGDLVEAMWDELSDDDQLHSYPGTVIELKNFPLGSTLHWVKVRWDVPQGFPPTHWVVSTNVVPL